MGDIAEVISGQSPEGKYYNQNGEGVPFYQGRTEFGDMYINSPKFWTTNSTKLAKRGDILMSVRAPVGPVNICDFEQICIGRGLAAIRSNNVNNMYLYWFLKSMENVIKGNGGAIFESINREQIKDILIPLPSIEDQKRIVAKLKEEQEIIDANKRLIDLMQDKINQVINRIYKCDM